MTTREDVKDIILSNIGIELDESQIKEVKKFVENCRIESDYFNRQIFGYDTITLNDKSLVHGIVAETNLNYINDNAPNNVGFALDYPYGMYGGKGVVIYPNFISIEEIEFLNECMDTLKDYPLLDESAYLVKEYEMQMEEVKEFIKYHSEYKEREEEIRNWFYDNSYIYDDSLDYSESDLIKYLES